VSISQDRNCSLLDSGAIPGPASVYGIFTLLMNGIRERSAKINKRLTVTNNFSSIYRKYSKTEEC